MILLILILTLGISSIGKLMSFQYLDTCPIFCQCYSAFDGYHVTCQNARLHEIPFNLTRFLQTTNHQNLIVDLSSNFLSTLPCQFFQISTIITLILTNNHIKYFPSCFSQSSIENLLLNQNQLEFNQTTILSSTKLIHLDISSNKFLSLPRTFFLYLRRLRRLIINNENNLFELNNDQWIRSLTTHNQLTLVICNEYFHLSLCLFENLFRTNKLLSLELNSNIYCDCSFVYLPLKKIHFHYCQTNNQQGICKSHFEHVHSLDHLQNTKYRQICLKEYQICHNNDKEFYLPSSQKFISLIKNSSTTTTTTTTITTIVSVISSKKDNIPLGAIISFIFVLFIVTLICLSRHLFQSKNREKLTKYFSGKKKSTVNSIENSTRSDECIPIENFNMNQQTNSYSDEEFELTFYSIQSSMTDIQTSNSSISNETICYFKSK